MNAACSFPARLGGKVQNCTPDLTLGGCSPLPWTDTTVFLYPEKKHTGLHSGLPLTRFAQSPFLNKARIKSSSDTL